MTTTYTHEQIALMAKLVPELTDNAWSRQSGTPMVVGDEWRGAYVMREWQPWSDWRDLGPLYLACCKWVAGNGAFTDAICDSHMDLIDALDSGDFDAFAAAVCNLALEIGKVCE